MQYLICVVILVNIFVQVNCANETNSNSVRNIETDSDRQKHLQALQVNGLKCALGIDGVQDLWWFFMLYLLRNNIPYGFV